MILKKISAVVLSVPLFLVAVLSLILIAKEFALLLEWAKATPAALFGG